MRKQTSINRVCRDYPNIMEKSNSYDGMDYLFFDDEPDYDEELNIPEWEEI